MAAHRRDRGHIGGCSETRIGRSLSALAIRGSVEPGGSSELAGGARCARSQAAFPCCLSLLTTAICDDPVTGLLPNKMKHGEEWEREGSVSYFDAGKLLFATGVGVRIHGGS